MLTTETQQGFGLKSKDMKMQTPSNERRISQKSNHTAVLVHIPMFWNRSGKKKLKKSRIRGRSPWEIYSRTFNLYTWLIHSWISLKKVRCCWWKTVSPWDTKPAFPMPMLTALLIWCSFSWLPRNQRHLQKKHYTVFNIGNRCWMLHSNNSTLLQSSNYQAFCVRKYSSSNLIHYDG